MEIIIFPETPVTFYRSALCRVSEDLNLKKHDCDNRKFQIEGSCSVYS